MRFRWHQRHSIISVLFACYLLLYMDRMAIATALPFIARDLGLSATGMGGVLSAFAIGYALMQLPGGLLADRFGPRRVITVAVVGWSLFTTLTGVATGLGALIATRVLFGLCEGPFPPSSSKAVATWFPPDEAGRASGLMLSAVQLGSAMAPAFAAFVIMSWGWRPVFYGLFVPGLAMASLAWVVIKDPPLTDDRARQRFASPPIRLGQLLRMRAVFWTAATIFLWNVASWGLMNWLPTYLLQARGFSIAKLGVLSPLPYLAGALGFYVGGSLAGGYFRHRLQVPIAAGLLLGGGATYIAVVVPQSELAIAAFMASFLCIFVAAGVMYTVPVVIVPQQAVGAAFGFINLSAQVAAFISPLAVGYALDATHGKFTNILYGFVGFFVLAAAVAVLGIRTPSPPGTVGE